MLVEGVEENYTVIPKNLNRLPLVVQNYYKQGLNKDFLDLIRLQDCHEFNPFPVPVINGPIEKSKYTPIFADDQDSHDLGKATIYVDDEGNLIKKSGLIFKDYKKIDHHAFKNFLLSTIKYEKYGKDWEKHPNGKKIMDLEEKIARKIERL